MLLTLTPTPDQPPTSVHNAKPPSKNNTLSDVTVATCELISSAPHSPQLKNTQHSWYTTITRNKDMTFKQCMGNITAKSVS